MASPKNILKNVWNAFKGRDPTEGEYSYMVMTGSTSRPDRVRYRVQNERSIVSSIINRIAVDASSIDIKHVKTDEDGNYISTMPSTLNYLLQKEANIDQTGRVFIQDSIQSMLDEGVVALVPIETDRDPEKGTFDVLTARVGKIKKWFPTEVLVEVYNELTGRRQELICSKYTTPIIENPFYSVMNEPNSTLQRLIRTLNQLDKINAEISSGKMDLIVQFPQHIGSDAKRKLAEERLKGIEDQLVGSRYGIAYIDGTERVIQLNRPVENNLWNQAKELEERLFNQLGFNVKIFDGTASDAEMTSYYTREIEPLLTLFVEEMERKWLTKTARTQGQAIRFFRNPFKLVPVEKLAEMSDKFTRNEIMTSNEVRTNIGLPPSDDPKANELRNSNLNHPDEKDQAKMDDQ